jgi:hypothetical protein
MKNFFLFLMLFVYIQCLPTPTLVRVPKPRSGNKSIRPPATASVY